MVNTGTELISFSKLLHDNKVRFIQVTHNLLDFNRSELEQIYWPYGNV